MVKLRARLPCYIECRSVAMLSPVRTADASTVSQASWA